MMKRAARRALQELVFLALGFLIVVAILAYETHMFTDRPEWFNRWAAVELRVPN